MLRFPILTLAVVFATAIPSAAQVRKPAPAPATARLDYRQVQSLKDATFYLDQAEPTAKLLADKVAPLKVGDPTVSIAVVKGLIQSREQAAQKLQFAKERLAALPATHPDVQAELARVGPTTESLATTEKKLAALNDALMGVVNQGAGNGFKADITRLREINQMFSDTQVFRTHPDRAVAALNQVEPAKAERQRIATTYAALMNQPTVESKLMRDTLAYSDEVLPAFEKAAVAYAVEATDAVGRECDDILKMANRGVADKNHLFFRDGGGIPSGLEQVKTKLRVLEAASPTGDGTVKSRARIATTEAEVKKLRAMLLDSIVASNRPPEAAYNGADKAQLIALVRARWTEAAVAGEVLAVGINSQDWQRDTRWEWNRSDRAFYKVDRSRAQGFVVIKSSDTFATLYYVNLLKDHLSGDKVTAHLFDDPKAEPDITRKIPIGSVK